MQSLWLYQLEDEWITAHFATPPQEYLEHRSSGRGRTWMWNHYTSWKFFFSGGLPKTRLVGANSVILMPL